MSSAYESADLLMKLYDLRREATMREARTWFVRTFHPTSAQEILDTIRGERSASYRMVTTYWEMAAAFVNRGAIDEQMFSDSNGEHVAVLSKIEPFLAEYRTRTGLPHYLQQLELLVMRLPNARERLAATRERLKPVD
ncbi:MAG: hypothetical protein AB7G23_01335 [Vicinamibacterales bacterium]